MTVLVIIIVAALMAALGLLVIDTIRDSRRHGLPAFEPGAFRAYGA